MAMFSMSEPSGKTTEQKLWVAGGRPLSCHFRVSGHPDTMSALEGGGGHGKADADVVREV